MRKNKSLKTKGEQERQTDAMADLRAVFGSQIPDKALKQIRREIQDVSFSDFSASEVASNAPQGGRDSAGVVRKRVGALAEAERHTDFSQWLVLQGLTDFDIARKLRTMLYCGDKKVEMQALQLLIRVKGHLDDTPKHPAATSIHLHILNKLNELPEKDAIDMVSNATGQDIQPGDLAQYGIALAQRLENAPEAYEDGPQRD